VHRLAILLSGAGSNMQAIVSACRRGEILADPVLVLSDRPNAAGLARASELGVSARALPIDANESRDQYDLRLLSAIEESGADTVALAGYMRILSTPFVAALQGRLLNIHPSLLPRHKGLHTHRRVLEAGDERHGATVHFVTPELDGGPGVLQSVIAVRSGDTESSLAERVRRCEHVIYPRVLGWLASDRLRWHDGRAVLDGNSLSSPMVESFQW
jgi:phosphoribosylglycinamide formyltransferase-1